MYRGDNDILCSLLLVESCLVCLVVSSTTSGLIEMDEGDADWLVCQKVGMRIFLLLMVCEQLLVYSETNIIELLCKLSLNRQALAATRCKYELI